MGRCQMGGADTGIHYWTHHHFGIKICSQRGDARRDGKAQLITLKFLPTTHDNVRGTVVEVVFG